jgi:hypothetical protein
MFACFVPGTSEWILFRFVVEGVHSCCYCFNVMRLAFFGAVAANGPIIHHPVDTDRGKAKDSEEPVPVPFCPPHIPHELPLAWTWAYTVKSHQLTACVVAWPWSAQIFISLM